MKISGKYLSKYFFVLIGIIISMFFLYLVFLNNFLGYSINVEKGTVNLYEELGEKVYDLIGEWEVYPNAIYSPGELSDNNFKKNYGYVDKNGSQLEGTKVTYSLVIDNKVHQKIKLRFPVFKGSYKIFLNGKLVSSNIEEWSVESEASYYNFVTIPLSDFGFNKVTVQMSRDDYFLFGFSTAPTIAKSEVFIKKDANVLTQKTVIVVSISFVALFLVILYYGSYGPRESKLALLYLCMASIVKYFDYIISSLFKFNNYNEYTKIFNLATIFSVFLVYCFVYKSFKKQINLKGYFETTFLITAFYSVFVIFSNVEHSDLVYRLSLVVYLYNLCSALHFTTIALNQRNKKAIYVFVVISILAFSFSINITSAHLYQFNSTIFVAYLISLLVILGMLVIENQEHALTYQNLEYNLIHKSRLKHTELVAYNDVLLAEIVARKEAEQSLVEITTKDYLTGLYNRLYGNAKLAEYTENFKSQGVKFSIIMLDIDNFKYINDTHGHDCGDEVLKSIAKIMVSSTRHSDVVTRWGGEEFLIILPNAKIESAVYVSEKIRKSIESYKMDTVGKITASLGVAEIQEGESFENTIIRADEFLYQAKRNGKNCTCPRIV